MNRSKYGLVLGIWVTVLVAIGIIILLEREAPAQVEKKSYQVLVNSDRDTPIQPDEELTLREAISLVNNTLSYQELSLAEQKQVKIIDRPGASRIEFDFSAPVKIELTDVLPALTSPGLVIDGTTHPAYDSASSATEEIAIPVPLVSLTVAKATNIFRGLTIAGDRITVKGLSIYGFGQSYRPTATTPGADIVIASRLPVSNRQLPHISDNSPQNVTIVDNWLGLPPDESLGAIKSNFGIWLFDGVNTIIRRNRIYHHGGSGILTSVKAQNAQITENIIVGNGLRGMPHAIYLDGVISGSNITDNLICGNDGSAVYLFKPSGATTINQNKIKFNGRRVTSAAVYLIGNDHKVTSNRISWQTGAGVTVAASPQSDRNFVTNNSFSYLEGLSIDLNTRNRVNNPFFKLGDGINPIRNSANRRLDTGNRAINAPQFLSEDFYLIEGRVHIDGLADPGSVVTFYQVEPDLAIPNQPQNKLSLQTLNHGPLTRPLADTKADDDGRFSFTFHSLHPGTIISAIATKPEAGTSEPAMNSIIQSLDKASSSTTKNDEVGVTNSQSSNFLPSCTTKPTTQATVGDRPNITKLTVPRNIQFTRDRAKISETTALAIDRIVAVLQQYPFLVIELQGSTDSQGNARSNLELNQRRVYATRNYLLKQGVRPERITIRPLGESKLKKPGNTIPENAYNRRVEIEFQDLRGIDIIFEEQNSDLQLEQ